MSDHITRAAWARIRRRVNLLNDLGHGPEQTIKLLRSALEALRALERKK